MDMLLGPPHTCFTGRLPLDTRPFRRLIGGIISPFVYIERALRFHHRAHTVAPASPRTHRNSQCHFDWIEQQVVFFAKELRDVGVQNLSRSWEGYE